MTLEMNSSFENMLCDDLVLTVRSFTLVVPQKLKTLHIA